MASDPIGIALEVIETLDALGVPYAIGGSLASSTYGIARATQDVDLVADLVIGQVEPLVGALRERYYIATDAVRRAIKLRGSFNLIHLEELYKIDVFVPGSAEIDRQQLARRRPEVLAVSPERQAYLLSPEDVVLQKLRWFRRGGEVSERQWRDVLGVLKVQGERLDLGYVRATAGTAGLIDLLDRVLGEAARPLG